MKTQAHAVAPQRDAGLPGYRPSVASPQRERLLQRAHLTDDRGRRAQHGQRERGAAPFAEPQAHAQRRPRRALVRVRVRVGLGSGLGLGSG